ncbi:MAG: glycosyltransferase [Patescibacteria group bacterium]
MKIALVTMEYPPTRGGVARYLWNLVKVAGGTIEVFVNRSYSGKDHVSAEDADEESALQTRNTQHASPSTADFTFHLPRRVRLFRRGLFGWTPAVGFIRSLKRQGYGLVLVSHLLPMGTAAWFAKMIGGLDYAVIIHGLDLRRARLSWRKRWLARQVLLHAKTVIANSQFTAQEIRAFDARLDPLVLTPGVEPIAFLSREEARKYVGLTEEDFIILTVTRLVARKGVDMVIRAMETLPPRAKFVIIGDGEDWERLEEMARPYGDRIKILTRVRDEDRNAWYAAADVFTLVARDAKDDVEGFGIVCLEAAQAGLPVLGGKSGGMPETIVDGSTGVLVDPRNMDAIRDALLWFMDHPFERQQMGHRGRERALRDFAWEERWKWFTACLGGGARPLVSIVIPVYNHAKELVACLESLERQTYRHLEIIAVDDGSTDNVSERLLGRTWRFPFTFTRFETNQGAPSARNEGFRRAKGEYVLFLDADVTLREDAIDRAMRALLLHPEAAFAYSAFRFGGKLFRSFPFSHDRLKRGNFIHTSSILRRTSFPGFDETLKKFQDWDLWLTIAERGGVGIEIPEVLMRMPQRKTGYSRWLPAFFHRIPWQSIGWMPEEIKRYRAAEAIIREKHHL